MQIDSNFTVLLYYSFLYYSQEILQGKLKYQDSLAATEKLRYLRLKQCLTIQCGEREKLTRGNF